MINKLKLDKPNLGPIGTWRVDRINGPSLCGSQSDLDHEPGCRISNFRDLLVPATLDLLLHLKDAMVEYRQLVAGACVDENPITAGMRDHRMSIPDNYMVLTGKDLAANPGKSRQESVLQVKLGAGYFRGLSARPKAPGGQILPTRVFHRIAGRFSRINRERFVSKEISRTSQVGYSAKASHTSGTACKKGKGRVNDV